MFCFCYEQAHMETVLSESFRDPLKIGTAINYTSHNYVCLLNVLDNLNMVLAANMCSAG